MSSMGFKVYEILKSKFSADESASLVDFFESKSIEKHESLKDIFATKEDLSNVEISLKQEITHVEISLKRDFFSFENKITRQLYWINIIQLLAIVTSVFALIKFVVK
jgi:hypothetical protein